MAQLYHLDGRPQTWAELEARFAAWQVREAKREESCVKCQDGWHRGCTGRRGKGRWQMCECECREQAPAVAPPQSFEESPRGYHP